MGAYGKHSSRLRHFEGIKLVTNLKETKEAKCKLESRWSLSIVCEYGPKSTDLQITNYLLNKHQAIG